MNKFAVAIFGPTGVGKSSIALELAKENGEIISVDSMQVYKFMDIGTAKPSKEDQELVKHHLIDVICPDVQFSAGEFKRQAQELIQQIFKNNKTPFLVGGTGLYFSSLVRGMIDIPKIDDKVKKNIILKWDKIGQQRMYDSLKRLDYDYSKIIHPNDKQRTLRALEVIIGTGKKYSSFLNKNNKKEDFNYILIGINVERKSLYEIINNRVDQMIENGLVDEVKGLLKKGYSRNNPGLKAIGYKEIIDYLDGKNSLEEAVLSVKKNSRRYAKRQLTWFRNISDVNWFENNDIKGIKEFLNSKINIL